MNAVTTKDQMDMAEMRLWRIAINDDIAMLIKVVNENGEAMIELVRLVSGLASNLRQEEDTIARIEEKFRLGLLKIDEKMDEIQRKMKETK
jgi:hypothetical protein